MPVSSALLIHTPGELRREWWSGEDLDALLTDWLAEGAALVPVDASSEAADAIVTAHAYMRAYKDLARRAAAGLGSKSLPGGLSKSTSGDTVKQWNADAATKKAERDAAIAAATAPVEIAEPASAPAARSRSIPIDRSW